MAGTEELTADQIKGQIADITTQEDAEVTDAQKEFLTKQYEHVDEFTRKRFKLEAPPQAPEGGGEEAPKLEDILTKDPKEVTTEERTVLEGNITELSDDDKKKFGVKEAAEEDVRVRGGKKEPEKKPEEKPKEPPEPGEDEEVSPEDKILIKKVVEEHTAPLVKELSDFREKEQERIDRQEVAEFVATHPEAKKYERVMLKHRLHPSRAEVPIEDIFYAAAGEDLMKIGVRRAKEAAEKAKSSGLGSGGRRPGEVEGAVEGLPDISKVVHGSKEEKALLDAAQRGAFTKR